MKIIRPILNDTGVTLVELMIVLVLSLLLMAAVYLTYQLQHASGQSQTQVVATQQDLRAAMDIISVDIMNSGANPDYPVTKQQLQGIVNTSGQNTLTLVMDLNGNGNTTDGGENVTYQLNVDNLNPKNKDLVRIDTNNANPTQPIANNVTQLAFTYLDSTYTPIVPAGPQSLLDPAGTLTNSQAQSVKFIRVAITKNSDQVDPQTHQYVTRHLQRTVCIRNGWING
ncbi:MAG: PilW family protein [Desulfomonilia bacterium]